MSMNDLLLADEHALATTQGWCLEHVYDQAPGKWRVMVLPAAFVPGASAEGAGAFVIGQARAGSALAQKALRIVMASHAAGPEKRKKK